MDSAECLWTGGTPGAPLECAGDSDGNGIDDACECDDFSTGSGSINAVVREVDARNRARDDGERLVRIHAVAFPVYWDVTGAMGTGGDYATLMRILCQRNGGTFVALPSRRDG